MKRLWIASLCLLTSTSTFAIPQRPTLWVPLVVKTRGSVSGWFELQPRWFFEEPKLDELIIRPAILWNFADGWNLGLGYADVLRFYSGNIFERRAWQQIQSTLKGESSSLDNRVRMEERYLTEGRWRYRIRHRILGTLDLGESKNWYGYGSFEHFWHFDNPARGIDQLRSAIGIGLRASADLSLEGGYLARIRYTNQKASAVDHAGVLSLTYTVPENNSGL
jgi:hypothetical protein